MYIDIFLHGSVLKQVRLFNLRDLVVKCNTVQKIKFSVKDLFSECDKFAVTCGFGHIYLRNP